MGLSDLLLNYWKSLYRSVNYKINISELFILFCTFVAGTVSPDKKSEWRHYASCKCALWSSRRLRDPAAKSGATSPPSPRHTSPRHTSCCCNTVLLETLWTSERFCQHVTGTSRESSSGWSDFNTNQVRERQRHPHSRRLATTTGHS